MDANINRREFLKFLATSGIFLISTGNICALSGCGKREPAATFERVYDFLAHLSEAEVMRPKDWCVQSTQFAIGDTTKLVLYEHPVSRVTFEKIGLYHDAYLSFGIGIDEKAWEKGGDGVLFEIVLTDDQSREHLVYSRYLDPKNNPKDRQWFEEEVDLKSFEGKVVSFAFKTSSGPKGNKDFDWAGWSSPRVISSPKRRMRTAAELNVILITVDTLRADYLRCYGMKEIGTTNIDKLASEGILFRNCICQSTSTNPSHASILTSLYPKDHQVYSNSNSLSEKTTSIANVMQETGFDTFATVSALHLNPDTSGFGKGFETFLPCGDFPAARAGTTNNSIFQWLRRNHKSQFFMWVHYFDPHAPYTPPEPHRTMYYQGDPRDPNNTSMKEVVYPEVWDKEGYADWLRGVTDIRYPVAQYQGEISYLDDQFGLLMKEIFRYGLEQSTLIVLTSDHGESLGEHNIYYDHAGLYDPSVRVPLIIWLPKKFSGKVIDASVMSVDIMPTILDMLGIKTSALLRGKSLLPLISGRDQEIHDLIFCEHINATQVMVKEGNWKYIKSLEAMPYTAKFCVTKDSHELYDVSVDPRELRNVSDTYPEVRARLDQVLTSWLKEKRTFAGPVSSPAVSEETKAKLRALGYAH